MLRFAAFFAALVSPAVAQSKVLYLTFDDGPQRGTAEVLEVLKSERIPGTFFLTGSNALNVGGIDAQRELVLRTVAEGHDLGNHCYIHRPMTKGDYRATYGDLSSDAQRGAFRANYERNTDHFRKILNQPDFRFQFARLPGDGSTFPHFIAETERMGMQYFHWQNEFAPSGDFKWLKNHDWHGAIGVAADYAELPRDGAVLLFHDRHWAGPKQGLLKNLISVLKAKGYTFGKLSERKASAPRTTSSSAQPPGQSSPSTRIPVAVPVATPPAAGNPFPPTPTPANR